MQTISIINAPADNRTILHMEGMPWAREGLVDQPDMYTFELRGNKYSARSNSGHIPKAIDE